MNAKEISQAVIMGIQDYFKKNNFQKAVIGLSGGLDSTVASYLVAKALGNKNLAAILMPEIGVTSQKNIKDAAEIAKKLKISYDIVSINKPVAFFAEMNKNSKKGIYALANAKARMRMVVLYYFANLNNALVIGTSDKSEIALGYTTKYGDNAADILVIGDLWKTEVVELGKYLGVPEKILRKKPSAELILNLDAEKELGLPYSVLDRILKMYIEEDLSLQKITEKLSGKMRLKKEHFAGVIKRIKLNEHKRRSPMLIRLSDRSFHGMEWRMPITNLYEEK